MFNRNYDAADEYALLLAKRLSNRMGYCNPTVGCKPCVVETLNDTWPIKYLKVKQNSTAPKAHPRKCFGAAVYLLSS